MEHGEIEKYCGDFLVALKCRGKSESTQEAYLRAVRRFLRLVKKKPVHEITGKDVCVYQVYLADKCRLAEKSVNIEMSGVKAFFDWVLGMAIGVDVPRMKEPKSQIEYFAADELERILEAIENKKHLLEVMLTFDAGLRLGELVRIRVQDVDLERRVIHIRNGKGKKDRRVAFGEQVGGMLKEYIEYNGLGVLAYLFEGQGQGSHISKRSIENIVRRACLKAGVRGKMNVHKLRHSFATHHVLNGTPLPMVQQLMGHKSIKTTLQYIHVADEALQAETPLAALWRNRGLDKRELCARKCG